MAIDTPDPRKFGNNLDALELTDFSDPSIRGQKVNVRIFTRAPGETEIGEGEHVYAVVGGVFKMFVKIQGKMKSVVLT